MSKGKIAAVGAVCALSAIAVMSSDWAKKNKEAQLKDTPTATGVPGPTMFGVAVAGAGLAFLGAMLLGPKTEAGK